MILGNSVFARCWSFMDSLLMSSLGIISCSMLDSVLILSRVLALPWLLFSQIWRLVVLQIWQNVFGAWQSQDLLAVQPLPSSMNMAQWLRDFHKNSGPRTFPFFNHQKGTKILTWEIFRTPEVGWIAGSTTEAVGTQAARKQRDGWIFRFFQDFLRAVLEMLKI